MASFSSPYQQKKELHAFSGIESPRKRRKVELSSRLYDVFINHRGPDVKLTLATQLYNSLENLGIRTFLDCEETELGDSFISTIETAIRSASVQIAIFSKGYAESPWCLAELVLMLESNAKIIPVFYQVQPSELRHIEKGVYADAFNKYEEKGRYPEKIKEWKEALQSVSFTTGYQFNNSEGWKPIVSAVQKGIQRTKLLHVAKYPVGLHKLVQDFERRCLDGLVRDFESQCRMSNESEEKAQIIGIFGMGGVGKTTLGKELFNKKRSKYHRASFLFDLREASVRGEFPSMQVKLLKDLFNEDHSSFPNVEDGTSCIKDCIEKSNILSVLIVLDDVDRMEQLDALLIKEMLNKSGNSLVIVTTRDVGVLISAGITVGYNLKVMDTVDARELFCWHAFGNPHPDLGYEVLVEGFLDVCRGLPLSLQVLGRHVCGRNQHYWRLELNKVNKTLPRDILQKLKISIEALDNEQKQIFMDIACFFVEQRKSMAIRVWEGSGWSAQHALETLKSKCLVEEIQQLGWNAHEWKEVEILRMHDHLRDLGREMADELSHPSRLWHPQMLKSLESKGFQYILAETKDRCFNSIFDMSMGSQITYFLGESDRSAERSTSLLWLQLDMNSSNLCKNIPEWIPLQNLQCLRISKGYLKRLWQSSVLVPSRLKELQIGQTVLEEFPDLLGISNNLETVVLDAEHMQIEAWSLLRRLRINLRTLDIRYARLKGVLTSNDDEEQTISKGLFIRDFNLSSGVVLNYQWLTGTGLSGLENLQIGSQKLVTKILITRICCPSLKSLKIYDMNNLIEVDLRGIMTLNFLEITNCENFKRLLTASDLTDLVVVNLSHCPELEESSLNVSYLAKMTIKNCWKTVARICEFGKLVELNISECLRLQELGFSHLISLERITIENCKRLKSVSPISDLRNLVELSIIKCWELDHELSLTGLNSLESIAIVECGKLQSIKLPTTLIKITLQACRELETVGQVCDLTKLTELSVAGCPKVEELSLTLLSCLRKIEIHTCEKLQSITLPTALIKFTVKRCMELQAVAGIGDFIELKELSISQCPKVEELSSLFQLSYLVCMEIRKCEKLQNIILPTTLTKLILEGCRELKTEAGIGDLTMLTEVSISECPKVGLSSLSGLNCLKKIEFDTCEKLQSMELPTTLIKLNVQRCRKLQTVAGIGDLTKLTELSISECPKIEELSSLAQVSCLQKIEFDSCEKLQNIAGIEELHVLETMQLSYCSNAAIRNCVSKLKNVPSDFIRLIGRADDGVESTLNHHLFSDYIAADAVIEIDTDKTDVYKIRSLLSAVIVCAVVVIDSLTSMVDVNESLLRCCRDRFYNHGVGFNVRQGEWIITMVTTQLYDIFSYRNGRQFEDVFIEHGIMKKGFRVTIKKGEEYQILPVLQTITERLYAV